MLINNSNLHTLFTGYKASFQKAFTGAPSTWPKVAMEVRSNTSDEKYGWVGNVPFLREWLGDRIIRNLVAEDYTIKNRDFEYTVGVPRNAIEDDQYGVYANFFQEMGRSAAMHQDELVYELLAAGFSTPCYDGQYFFDTDHPYTDGEGATVGVSNIQAGSDTPWFLMDTTRNIRPLILQKRRDYQFVSKDDPSDENVFMRKEYLYGCDGRLNAGFGFWQLAFASKAPLTAENYAAARAAMMAFKGDGGRRLGVMPNLLVVPPSLEADARKLLKNGTRVETVGETPIPIANEWVESAEMLVTPFLA